MKKFLGTTFALVLSATACAATANAAAPLYGSMPANQWAGWYFGGQVGGGWGNHDRANANPFANSYSSSGVVGGVFGGYNWVFNPNWLLGVEADVDASSMSGNDGGVGGSTDTTEIPWSGTINARAGVTFGRALLYVSSGLAVAGATQSNAKSGLNAARTLTGWDIGGGLDYAFTEKLFGRIAYRYKQFGTESYPSGPGVAAFTVATQTQEILFGLGMKLP